MLEFDEESGKGKRKKTRGDALRHAFGDSQKFNRGARRSLEKSIHPEEEAADRKAIKEEDAIQRGLGASLGRNPASVQQAVESGAAEEYIERQQEQQEYEKRIIMGEQMIATDSGDAATLINETGEDIPEAHKEDFQRKMARGTPITEGNENNPLRGKFAEGIAAFLPMIVGAAFGGTQGLAQATGATNTLLKAQAGPKAGKTDITPDFVDKKTGNPVFTKEVNGQPKFIDDQGREVASSQVEPISAEANRLKSEDINARHQDRLRAAGGGRAESFFKSFRKDQEKTKTQVDSIDNITNIIDSGKPITSDQIATFNARGIFDEVGRLSDDDVRRAKVPLNVYRRFKNDITEAISGSADSEMRKIASTLLKFVSKNKKEKLLRDISKQGNSARAKRLGFKDAGELQSLLKDELGLDFEDKKEEKKTETNYRQLNDQLKQFLESRNR